MVGIEDDGAHFDSLSGDVFLLKLSGDVSLDESGLSNTSISDENDLEFGNWLDWLHLIMITSIS